MPYEIGRLLRRRREWARLSQQELVEYTGLDRSASYISAIENGRSSPTVDELDRLCRYFRTNLIDFLRECEGEEAGAPPPGTGTTEEERLLRAFAALSSADQLLAAELVELLSRHQRRR